MLQTRSEHEGKAGFALIVVLVTLGILTLLFAISSDRTISNFQTQSSELTILKTHQELKDLLVLASQWKSQPENKDDMAFTIPNVESETEVSFIDVGGLVDLNTAHIPLANAFIQFIGGGRDEQERYLQWRRIGIRMKRVSELPHILDYNLPVGFSIEKYATVFSGRSGINLKNAPNEFVGFLKQTGVLEKAPSLNTPNHGSIFSVVVLHNDIPHPIYAGVVRIGEDSGGILLQFR